MISALVAVGVTMQIAGSHPSWLECMPLAFVPAIFAVLSLALLLFSIEVGRDDFGDGGRGADDAWPPRGPTGGLEVDWDAFEADFRAYAEQHERVLV